MRQPFDISVGTSVAAGIVDVDFFTAGPDRVRRATVTGGSMYCFPLILEEAKLLRDMLNDGIEHVEAGGHGNV